MASLQIMLLVSLLVVGACFGYAGACDAGDCKALGGCGDCQTGYYCSSCPLGLLGSTCVRETVTNQFTLVRIERGGAPQATDMLNGKLLCGCDDVHACAPGSTSGACTAP